ncbi:glycosyltransferase [bacterium]|nr:glycosyltransferase [bacterium]
MQCLLSQVDDAELAARIANDLGVLAALRHDWVAAQAAWQQASAWAPTWEIPQQHLRLSETAPRSAGSTAVVSQSSRSRPTRIGLVSLLFNWPSTGGGTVHTAETARFLTRAGYEIRHWVLSYPGWSVGQVTEPTDWPIEFLDFDDQTWSRPQILARVRAAVEHWQPDHVIVTDSWNFKPHLASALSGYSYFLRLAAQECLCPLNNVRLLGDGQGGWQSCPRQQLATPEACQACLQQRGRWSGSLHQAERELAGVPEADYPTVLRRAFRDATGVLVVNPLIAENVKPFAERVHVLPSGFAADRFPAPAPVPMKPERPLRLLFAGLVDEVMKGYAILERACARLWSVRQDFRLVVTGAVSPTAPDFVEFVGWQTQAELPRVMRDCDIVVCPTVAEEALGRTAVEAMGAGRPVVASRIGGLPFTVLDEATGLLCPPGDIEALAHTLKRLLDEADLRVRLGQAGRQRFLSEYTWEAILPRYRQLLGPVTRPVVSGV